MSPACGVMGFQPSSGVACIDAAEAVLADEVHNCMSAQRQ